jgi:hypothetical protein
MSIERTNAMEELNRLEMLTEGDQTPQQKEQTLLMMLNEADDLKKSIVKELVE